jgi:hypothetical protein
MSTAATVDSLKSKSQLSTSADDRGARSRVRKRIVLRDSAPRSQTIDFGSSRLAPLNCDDVQVSRSWKPEPAWVPLAGAEGQATGGVWRVPGTSTSWVVKRLNRPAPGSTACEDRRSFQWWRREIEVASSGLPRYFHGLVAPRCRVDEDEDGATLWFVEVETTDLRAGVVAEALGRFACVEVPDPGWFTQHRLRDRVMIAAAHDSSRPALSRLGEVGPMADEVWTRRHTMLDRLDALPQVLSHGDALPRNLLRHDRPSVTAIDWGQLGYAPIGADLATYSMWVQTDLNQLLDAYLAGFDPVADACAARAGLTFTTALIAVSRAIRTAGTPAAPGYQVRLQRATRLLHEALLLSE